VSDEYGKFLIDIRKFIKNPKGTWIATDKGLRFSLDGKRLDEVLELVEQGKKRRQEIEQERNAIGFDEATGK